MIVTKVEGSVPIKAWVENINGPELRSPSPVPNIEASAMLQLSNLAKLPFIHQNGIAVMPDVHAGIGSTVGSVIATVGAIIPAAVGVDIGCGMNALKTSLKASQLPESLHTLRMEIERTIPLNNPAGYNYKNIDLAPVPSELRNNFYKVYGQYNKPDIIRLYTKAWNQLGTLGSGNHFIELCLDENDSVWIMLHSGSRGIGNIIGSEYITIAKELMEKYFIDLEDPNLAYLPEDTNQFGRYIAAMTWAQEYAYENRAVMMRQVVRCIESVLPHLDWGTEQQAISCHHNYSTMENHFGKNMWITRKGAVRARKDDLGIIPGARGAKSYIVRGKGNAESYCSCSHGAGRVMSRGEARKRFTQQDLIEQSEGVECSTDLALVDEIRGAYKDIDVVMENQKDLVRVVHTLRAILNVKGA